MHHNHHHRHHHAPIIITTTMRPPRTIVFDIVHAFTGLHMALDWPRMAFLERLLAVCDKHCLAFPHPSPIRSRLWSLVVVVFGRRVDRWTCLVFPKQMLLKFQDSQPNTPLPLSRPTLAWSRCLCRALFWPWLDPRSASLSVCFLNMMQ